MDDMPDITWRYLRDRINEMPEERLDDLVQILRPQSEEPIPLDHAIMFNTIRYYSSYENDDGSDGFDDNYTRGSIDNTHHPEHFALLTDVCPFNEHGDTIYTWTEEGMIGNNSGRNYGSCPFGPFEEED